MPRGLACFLIAAWLLMDCAAAADDNRTGSAKVAHNRRVAGCDEISEGGKAVRCCLTLLVDIHLDCDWNSEQRPGFGQLDRQPPDGRQLPDLQHPE